MCPLHAEFHENLPEHRPRPKGVVGWKSFIIALFAFTCVAGGYFGLNSALTPGTASESRPFWFPSLLGLVGDSDLC